MIVKGFTPSYLHLLLALVALPLARLAAQDPCETVVVPTDTVIGAADMTFDGKCIVIERGSRVTIDGAHSFHGVTIEAGSTVTHSAGGAGRISWTVATEVSVLGTLDVSGGGFSGTNDGGEGGSSQTAGMASTCDVVEVVPGGGPLAGGSHGGHGGSCGSMQCLAGEPAPPYGSPNEPCLPGGGGGACGDGHGGNGGGVIWIQAETIRVNGTVTADGAAATNRADGAGGGAGGSIYLSAANLLGSGRVRANGGGGAPSFAGGGGAGGRVAAVATAQLAIPEDNFEAFGGAGAQGCPPGGVGTIWLRLGDLPPTLLLGACRRNSAPRVAAIPDGVEMGRVVLRGPLVFTPQDWLVFQPARLEVLCEAVFLVDESFSFPTSDALFVNGGRVQVEETNVLGLPTLDGDVLQSGTLEVAGAVEVASGEITLARNVTVEQLGRGVHLLGEAGALLAKLTVEAGANVTHRGGGGHAVVLSASEELGIDGSINVIGMGIPAADGVDVLDTLAVDPASTCDTLQLTPGAGALAGGSHGGFGATCGTNQCIEAPAGTTYDSIARPCLPGSPGGACGGGVGGAGGGVVHLEAPTVRVNGTVDAGGGTATNLAEGAGGGSGGSISIVADNVLGRGRIRANGGTGAPSFGGGGGSGGRIALHVAAQMALTEDSLDASGGTGAQGCPPGQVGTIWVMLGETSNLILGTCRGVGAIAAPVLDGLEPLDRLVVRGPVRLTSDTAKAIGARRVDLLCGGTFDVDKDIELTSEDAMRLDGGALEVVPGATLALAEWTTETVRAGTVRLAGMVQVESGVVTLGRNVTVEQVGRGIRFMGAAGGPLQSLSIEAGATMTHTPGFGHEVQVTASEEVSIAGTIDVSGRGLSGSSEAGLAEAIDPASLPGDPRPTTGAASLAGGSHGGAGATCGNDQCTAGDSNTVYGNTELPVYPGSGGGACGGGAGGAGGGIVRIDAPLVRVNGTIAADGGVAMNLAAGAGGGSGGSILLLVDNLLGSGRLRANGGSGAPSFGGGGGGGGRIAVRFGTGVTVAQNNMQALGGRGAQGCPDGAEGTVTTVNSKRATRFLRADCDGDSRAATITDAVVLLSFNFLGANEPACLAACDADGDGVVRGRINDAVYSLNFSFLGGPAPPAPFPECGLGTQKDQETGCKSKPAGCL